MTLLGVHAGEMLYTQVGVLGPDASNGVGVRVPSLAPSQTSPKVKRPRNSRAYGSESHKIPVPVPWNFYPDRTNFARSFPRAVRR